MHQDFETRSLFPGFGGQDLDHVLGLGSHGFSLGNGVSGLLCPFLSLAIQLLCSLSFPRRRFRLVPANTPLASYAERYWLVGCVLSAQNFYPPPTKILDVSAETTHKMPGYLGGKA